MPPARVLLQQRAVSVPLMAGVLLALARPGLDNAVFWPIGLGLLIASAQLAGSLGGAALRGALAGVACLPVVFAGLADWGWYVPLSAAALALLLYFLPLAALSYFAHRRFTGAPLFLFSAAAWTLVLEVGARLHLPATDAASWLTLWPGVLAGARVVGTSPLSALLFAGLSSVSAALIAAAPYRQRLRCAALGAGSTVAIVGVLGAVAYWSAEPARGTRRIGIPQLDVPTSYQLSRLTAPSAFAELEQKLASQLGELGPKVDVIALSEAYDGRFQLMLPSERERWSRFARAYQRVVLLTSYLVETNGRKSNAIGVIDEAGVLRGIHRKVQLAPFGERELSAGSRLQPIVLGPELRLGLMICIESFGPAISRELTAKGANLLVASTSDTTFESSVLPFEHAAAARLRAIETGRSLVWASNSGPSGVIDRWGGFEAGPFRRASAIVARAELHDELTPYVRYGALAPVFAALIAALCLAFARRSSVPVSSERVHEPIWIASGAAAVAAATWLVAPALVEVRHGEPSHASRAIVEMFSEPQATFEGGALAHYRTTSASVEGALALWLTYYGVDVTPERLVRPIPASFAELPGYLREHYGVASARQPLSPAPPHVASLVQFRNGQVGVLHYSGGADAELFTPAAERAGRISLTTIPKLLGSDAIVPELDLRHLQ